MSLAIGPPVVRVRDAEPADNDALLAIAAACPMEGDIAIRVTREPDFFQLNRLEGARWRLGVAEMDGRIAGCVMGAERRSYVHGEERTMLYTGDLKVHPDRRRAGVADALSDWVRDTLAELGGDDTPVLLTILRGNDAMERRTIARGRVASMTRFATIRVCSIPLLLPRAFDATSLRVRPATLADVEEMAALWARVAPTRQFAAAFTAEEMAEWIATAPGLDISDYRLARNRAGRIVGFLAWWDQTSFKQMQIMRYSPRLRVAKTIIDGVARLTRGMPLPERGASLRYRTALHVCVPGDSPEVLAALLRSGYRELRGARYAFAMIGLDVRDPLGTAVGGLFAQPTDVDAYVLTPGGVYAGPTLADRPLHYEIALV